MPFFYAILLVFFVSSTSLAQENAGEDLALPNRSDPKTVYLTNGEWPPYTSQHLDHYGFVSRIIEEAFRVEGYNVVYGFFPWKRSYELAKKGQWDGSVGWVPTEERQSDFIFSDNVADVQKYFFHLKNTEFDWAEVEDLKGYRLGVAAGYTYGPEFDELWHNGVLATDESNNETSNLVKLLRGRIDAFPIELEVGYYLIHSTLRKRDIVQITNHPQMIMQSPVALGISRQLDPARAEEILSVFNRGLATLRELGIYEKYRDEMMPRS